MVAKEGLEPTDDYAAAHAETGVRGDTGRTEGVVVQLVKKEGDVPVMVKLNSQWWLNA